MPLPVDPQTTWPPESAAPMLSKQSEWAAWYSGEPARIIDVYSSPGYATTHSPVPWWRFWSRARAATDGAMRAQLHVPLASDLAAMSGSLLMGESPRIRIRAAREQDDPDEDVLKAEKRLLEIAERSDLYARLVEAAESAAAIGGIYIYPAWDTTIADHPFMAVAQADMAVPEFRHGYLVAVTFSRVVDQRSNNRIVRQLERHEVENGRAVVYHGLYLGSPTKLGVRIALDPDLVGPVKERMDLPIPGLDVRYIPNRRPNPIFRANAQGVADIQGSETLLDALDETHASWIRDIRLAKARILVPREYLRQDPDTRLPAFDVDQEIYVGLDMDPGLSSDVGAMLAHQFQIRHEAHRATAQNLIARIVSNAGYEDAAAVGGSGAALRVNQRKTLLTLKRKSAWWRAALTDVLYGMQLIDQGIFRGPKPIRPTVQTADSIIDSPLELAQTALALKMAEAASTETRVRLVNPDWSNAEVKAEVLRISGEVTAAPLMPGAVVAGAEASPGSFGSTRESEAAIDNKPITTRTIGVSDNPAGKPGPPPIPPFPR